MNISPRSSSREVGIRVPFSVVYFSRGTLHQKSWSKGTSGGPSLLPVRSAEFGLGLRIAASLRARWPSGALLLPGWRWPRTRRWPAKHRFGDPSSLTPQKTNKGGRGGLISCVLGGGGGLGGVNKLCLGQRQFRPNNALAVCVCVCNFKW